MRPPPRRRLAHALVALAIALVAALAHDARADAPIRLWHAYRGDEERALTEILAAWKGAPVEVLAVPYDALGSKLAASIPLGQGPDLFIDAHERLGDFRARGLVAPVGDAFVERDAFLPQAVAAVSEDGVAWAVPLSQKCVALYVNVALAPRWQSEPTLDDIAKSRSVLPDGTFVIAWENSAYAQAGLFAAYGAHLLGPNDQFGLVGPGADAAARMARELVDRRVVPEDADGALVTSLFKSGRAAFAISGPWLAAEIGPSSDALRYYVTELPVVGRPNAGRMHPLMTFESVMLSPRGAARADVRALARRLADRAAAETRVEIAHALTVRVDVEYSADPILVGFRREAEYAEPMPSRVAMRAVWEPANRAIRKVLRHDAEPEVAFEEAKRQFDDVRRPLPPRASPVPALFAVGLLGLAAAIALVRRAQRGGFAEVKRSLPAYAYVAHAV
ncbi:MAG TPA: extracellular solute-binding protein, partial [Byssovorax sp.]